MVSDMHSSSHSSKDAEKNLVYGHKLSSVGPGEVTGGDVIYEPSNIDLAMKLHYIRVVYFLDKQAVEEFTVRKIKECTFAWCNYYYETCGRFRRGENSDDGRPYIKCNDCGMRFVEAKSDKTVEEWVQMGEVNTAANQRLLVANHVLGPELTFSPPVFLQLTFFKCGGMSLGVSWAHVLGDVFSVANCLNSLAQFLNGYQPPHPPQIKKSPTNFEKPAKATNSGPLSLKEVGPVGDHWIVPTTCEMDTFSFHVTHTQLGQLQTKLRGNDQTQSPIQPFESLCAVTWKAVAKVKVGLGPNVVTVVKKYITGPIEDERALRNNQVVSSVKADFSVEEAQTKDLAALISDWAQDERAHIGEMVNRYPGGSDVIMYGSNLTFVDLGEAGFYGFKLKGFSPKFVNCFVDGIGEEGVVLVLPAPKIGNNLSNDLKAEGRIVTLILPKSCMMELKEVLNKEWALIA